MCANPSPFKGRLASRDVVVGEREKGDTNSVSANSALVTGQRVSRTETSRGQSRQPMSDRAPSELRLRDRFVCLPNSVPVFADCRNSLASRRVAVGNGALPRQNSPIYLF